MSNTQRKTKVAALICAVLFTAGLAKLFWLRFEAGDLYPPYSSLRGDPLGTQVLYESLNRIRENSARRNYRPLDQIRAGDDNTWLVMGLSEHGGFLKNKSWEKLLDRITLDGGRLVISFRSTARKRPPQRDTHQADENEAGCPIPGDENSDARGKKPGAGAPGEQDDGSAGQEGQTHDDSSWRGALAALGISVKPSEAEILADSAQRAPLSPDFLPTRIPWRSPYFFVPEDSAWQPLYEVDGEPVIAFRSWGKGSVVMASDSYLFSNEALRKDRLPRLLMWFIQPAHRVIMDEYHHGLIKQPGIVDLMRKYRLHGVMATLVLLLLLLLWRQTAVFVTRPAETVPVTHDIEAGSDTFEGLVGLMQQHIRTDELLGVCYTAWHTSTAAAGVTEERMAQVKRVVAGYNTNPRRKDIVTAYQQICKLLKQGKFS